MGRPRLEVGQEVLTDARVLCRAIPQAERVFLPVGRDAERHDEAMLTDVHAVDDQPDEVERLKRRGLHGYEEAVWDQQLETFLRLA